MPKKNTDSEQSASWNDYDDFPPLRIIKITLSILAALAALFGLHMHIDWSASRKDVFKQCGKLTLIGLSIIALIAGAVFYVLEELKVWRIL